VRASDLLRPAIWSYAVQRLCTWYPLRRALAGLIAALRPRHVQTATTPEALRLEGDLHSNGVAFLPQFVDRSTIESIKLHLQGAQLSERFPPCRKGFTLEQIPENVHVAEYGTEHILRCPEVLALANHPTLLGAAGRYLGCKPTISNISIWWSVPADGTAQEAENYHRDVDDWRFVKFFLYLTDVDADCGPHCFVRGSHRRGRFLRIKRRTDPEVTASFQAQDMLRIEGRAGDAFLEDTFGLHKGQPPTGKWRLLLQVEYSVNPIAVYSYRPIPLNVAVDRYINRLYVQPSGPQPT
jgi:hypothetical protein